MCRNGRCRVADGHRAPACPREGHRRLHQVRRLRSLAQVKTGTVAAAKADRGRIVTAARPLPGRSTGGTERGSRHPAIRSCPAARWKSRSAGRNLETRDDHRITVRGSVALACEPLILSRPVPVPRGLHGSELENDGPLTVPGPLDQLGGIVCHEDLAACLQDRRNGLLHVGVDLRFVVMSSVKITYPLGIKNPSLSLLTVALWSQMASTIGMISCLSRLRSSGALDDLCARRHQAIQPDRL
jgi:hypothetical protein